MPTYSKKCDGTGICKDNEKKSCDIRPVLLCCGQGMSVVFPGNSENQPIIPTPSTANIGQVSVNTADLCKPVVEIEFSSIISLITTNNQFGKAALSFQLFRVCDEEEATLVNSWFYEVFSIEDDNNIVRLTESFSFIFCECLDCPCCCDYFVEVSVGGLEFIESISVDNVQIAALVGESGDCDKKITCTKSYQKLSDHDQSLLSCGDGVNGSFVNIDLPPIPIGRVFVDTRNICKPTVSIEFSSTVNYLQTSSTGNFLNNFTGGEGSLEFKLFRACDDGKLVLLNSWRYARVRIARDTEETRLAGSFEFNFCDDLACSGCCEYLVEVNVTGLIGANVFVDNVHITALVS